jgi:hypothetical protein
MKKRTAIIVVLVASGVGAWSGFFVSTWLWLRVVEDGTVSSSLYHVSAAYAPLKMLKEGQTEKATKHLQVELRSALENVDLMSTTLHRPDMLTNSVVVRARAFDK